MAFDDTVYRDELRVNGIQCKGYGQIAKIAMLDPALTLEAKAVYSYFCSYCGGGNTAFPGRDKILSDLRISKNTYYKHFRLLTDSGYITVEQKAGNENHSGFYKNIYTIEAFPARFRSEIDTIGNEVLEAALKKVIREENITAAGYGNIPKSVMQADLSVQAKGIYAYLCSFSGQDYTASPSRDVMLYHLKISHNTATKYVSELVTSSLISTHRTKENGKITGFKYCLNQRINLNSDVSVNGGQTFKPEAVPQPNICDTRVSDPEPRICDADNKPELTHSMPEPRICDTQIDVLETSISDTQFSDTQICDGNNISSNKTKNNNNNTELNLSFTPVRDLHEPPERVSDEIDSHEYNRNQIIRELNQELTLPYSYLKDRKKLGTAIRVLTDWDVRTEEDFYYGANAKMMEKLYLLFVETLTDMLTLGKNTTIRGSQINYSMVYDQLTQNYMEIQKEQNWFGEVRLSLGSLPDDVIEAFLEANQTTKIKNPKSYMCAIIWTVLQQNGLRYILDAERDLT